MNYRLCVIFILLLTILIYPPYPSYPQSLASPPRQGELAVITTPTTNAVVRGVISIRGSAVHPNFDRFQVAYAREPVVRNDQWITIGIERRDQVVNGELAIWDTTQVPDGSYRLRLRVIRTDGNYGELEVKQIVIGNAIPIDTPTLETEALIQQPPAGSPRLVTATSTPIADTPTPAIVQLPEVETPTATPRVIGAEGILPTPRPDSANSLPIPTITNFDPDPLRAAFLWGIGGMLLIFFGFGFLSATRIFILGFLRPSKSNILRRRWWK